MIVPPRGRVPRSPATPRGTWPPAGAPFHPSRKPTSSAGSVAYCWPPQHFRHPGWVEHDPVEIWAAVPTTLAELATTLTEPIAAIGITDQRETVVAWDRRTGQPRHRAIVWQDRRTAARC